MSHYNINKPKSKKEDYRNSLPIIHKSTNSDKSNSDIDSSHENEKANNNNHQQKPTKNKTNTNGFPGITPRTVSDWGMVEKTGKTPRNFIFKHEETWLLEIVSARKLSTPTGNSNPSYVKIFLNPTNINSKKNKLEAKSEKSDSSFSPQFKSHWLLTTELPTKLLVEVWSSKGQFHGQLYLEIMGDEEINKWFKLSPKENEIDDYITGQLLVKVCFFNRSKNNVKRKFVIEEHKDIDYANIMSTGDPEEIFINKMEIDKGGFSTIYTAVNKKTKERVAVKIVLITNLNFSYVVDEIVNHKTIKHPNIVTFYEAFWVIQKQQLWMILEYLPGGNLFQRILKEDRIPEPEMAFVLQETLRAIAYLHHFGKIHRDIKSDNILYGADGSIKLADFGFATSIRDVHYQSQVVGTYNWLAPESIRKEGYGEGVDIWAIGVVTLEMLQKDPPYWGLQKQEIMEKIKTEGIYLEKSTKCSEGVRDFFQNCVKMDPKHRSSALSLLSHPWILLNVPLYHGFSGTHPPWDPLLPFLPLSSSSDNNENNNNNSSDFNNNTNNDINHNTDNNNNTNTNNNTDNNSNNNTNNSNNNENNSNKSHIVTESNNSNHYITSKDDSNNENKDLKGSKNNNKEDLKNSSNNTNNKNNSRKSSGNNEIIFLQENKLDDIQLDEDN